MYPDLKRTTLLKYTEEIEGRVTKKLSQEFSRTKSRILGTLSRLDEFILNPLVQGYSGTTPETSRNTLGTNQGTNEDDSQCDPHPQVGIFQSQNTRSFGPDDDCDNKTPPNREKLGRKIENYQRNIQNLGRKSFTRLI